MRERPKEACRASSATERLMRSKKPMTTPKARRKAIRQRLRGTRGGEGVACSDCIVQGIVCAVRFGLAHNSMQGETNDDREGIFGADALGGGDSGDCGGGVGGNEGEGQARVDDYSGRHSN